MDQNKTYWFKNMYYVDHIKDWKNPSNMSIKPLWWIPLLTMQVEHTNHHKWLFPDTTIGLTLHTVEDVTRFIESTISQRFSKYHTVVHVFVLLYILI